MCSKSRTLEVAICRVEDSRATVKMRFTAELPVSIVCDTEHLRKSPPLRQFLTFSQVLQNSNWARKSDTMSTLE